MMDTQDEYQSTNKHRYPRAGGPERVYFRVSTSQHTAAQCYDLEDICMQCEHRHSVSPNTAVKSQTKPARDVVTYLPSAGQVSRVGISAWSVTCQSRPGRLGLGQYTRRRVYSWRTVFLQDTSRTQGPVTEILGNHVIIVLIKVGTCLTTARVEYVHSAAAPDGGASTAPGDDESNEYE